MERARKLRTIGRLVLACGIALAVLFYWLQTRSANGGVDELAAGYTRAQEHQAKVLMGPLAVAMSQWADALTAPGTEAILIAAFAAFVAYMCFRHAKMEEADGRH